MATKTAFRHNSIFACVVLVLPALVYISNQSLSILSQTSVKLVPPSVDAPQSRFTPKSKFNGPVDGDGSSATIREETKETKLPPSRRVVAEEIRHNTPENPQLTQSQSKPINVYPVEAQPRERQHPTGRGLDRKREEATSTQLPPRLAPTLAHLKRPSDNSLKEPYDWKHPAMLTVLGIPEGDALKLAIFSTGVDLMGFSRRFHFLGCLIGNKTYPGLVKDQRSPHYCVVDSKIATGAKISMLLRRDEVMEGAIAEPLVDHGFIIENSEDDFLKLDTGVVVDDEVRKLAEGYEIVTIKSNVTWHEGLREASFNPVRKRFEFCLMTAMRQYPFLMQQWFDYYRQVGVDQIYVYDNVAAEDLSKFESDFVQTAFWPFGRSQQQSFNHFLLLSKNRCKYVGFFDADEYAFAGGTGPDALKHYVKKRVDDGYDQICFPFIVMSGGGHIARPDGFLPELYVRRNLRQAKFNVGKTVIVSEARWSRHAVHMANGGRKTYKNSSFELNPSSLEHNGMLVHYTQRSYEEFILKHNTGGASVMTNARAPRNLSLQNVPSYYTSNESTAEFLTFRDYWRNIMKLTEPKHFTLSWRVNDKDCTQQFCVACNGTEMGEVTCN